MKQRQREYTHLDLFSGIGGFSLAFEAEGFRTIGFSEIDPYACAVLKKHWPTVPNFGDVRTIPAIQCDVITGGFPCQPFSVAGKRRGKADDRHLWPAMLAVIERCRPAWVLSENVPGIIGMELDSVLSDLETIGYTCQAFTVPACAVDARHRRDRLWIVAHTEHCWRGEQMQIAPTWSSFLATERTEGAFSSRSSGQDVADSNCQGLPQPAQTKLRSLSSAPGQSEGRQSGRGNATPWRNWPTEPAVGRVVNGLPNRLHRLKCLGNSIVPQVAQVFARAIYQALDHETTQANQPHL